LARRVLGRRRLFHRGRTTTFGRGACGAAARQAKARAAAEQVPVTLGFTSVQVPDLKAPAPSRKKMELSRYQLFFDLLTFIFIYYYGGNLGFVWAAFVLGRHCGMSPALKAELESTKAELERSKQCERKLEAKLERTKQELERNKGLEAPLATPTTQAVQDSFIYRMTKESLSKISQNLFSVKTTKPDLAERLKADLAEDKDKQLRQLFSTRYYEIPDILANKQGLKVSMEPVEVVLGKGSFGQVEKACHLDTGEEVAVKVIRLSSEKKDSGFQRTPLSKVKEERDIHLGLIHRNVVRLYGGFKEESRYYMILELVPGKEDLLDFLLAMKEENIEEATTKEMFDHLIQGVAYLHGQGVVHRDLKPENIMVCKGSHSVPVLKIADLGEAEKVSADSNIMCKTRKGTLQTRAPEVSQLNKHGMKTRRKKEIDGKKADLWSLGMILHVMVALEYPSFADVHRVGFEAKMKKLAELAEANTPPKSVRLTRLFDTEVWDKQKRSKSKYKWTDLDKVKKLVKGLLKPTVTYRWDLKKVKHCSWFDDDKAPEDDEDKNEEEVDYADSESEDEGEGENEGEVDEVDKGDSQGPRKADGTLDMRYKVNRR